MSQAREKGGRVVFIGNIPYGMEKEDIEKLFGQIGKVVSLRLVVDKDTQRPKGFGFLEYGSPAEADSAIRNLNNKEIQGRTLRVDYSNDNEKGNKPGGDDGLALPMSGQPDTGALPALPAGVEIAPGLTAPDAISKTVSALPAPQLLDILSQMKALVTSDPAKATSLLQQAPQLSFALFQALLLLNLVNTDILSSLVASAQGVPPPQPPPPQAVPPTAFQPHMPPGYAPIPPPYGQQQGYPAQNFATPPPPSVTAYQAPPVQQPSYGAPPPGFTPEIIEAVRRLTRDQIMGLEEAHRNEVIKIRVAVGLPPVPN